MEFELTEKHDYSIEIAGMEVLLSIWMGKLFCGLLPEEAEYIYGRYVYTAIMTKKEIAIARAKVIDGMLGIINIYYNEGYRPFLNAGAVNETHEHEANKKRKD